MGEKGNDPAADQAHQAGDQPESGNRTMPLQGKIIALKANQRQQVAEGQQAQHDDDRIVAHLFHFP